MHLFSNNCRGINGKARVRCEGEFRESQGHMPKEDLERLVILSGGEPVHSMKYGGFDK